MIMTFSKQSKTKRTNYPIWVACFVFVLFFRVGVLISLTAGNKSYPIPKVIMTKSMIKRGNIKNYVLKRKRKLSKTKK